MEFYPVAITTHPDPLIKNVVNIAVYFEGLLAKNVFGGALTKS